MRSAASFLVVVSLLLVAVPCGAPEKGAVRVTDEDLADSWMGVGTYTVVYYNTCTGWIWLWGGWNAGDIIGTCYENTHCGPNAGYVVCESLTYFRDVMPAGYGFTGTIAVQGGDANMCPTVVLASAPLLPAVRWNINFWNIVVPPRFVVTYEFGPATDPDSTAWLVRPATDHPAAGPTGPAACGYCYPTTRVGHSFYYGSASSPRCPGSAFNDGICDAEWLGMVFMICKVFPVEEDSWGSVKNLYR